MSLNGEGVARRRRGVDLENALLDAAWRELADVGFDDLTFEAVARRAATSRAVLYRRWPSKAELVAAAARHAIATERGPVPEPTGTLRGDLLAWLRWANRTDVRTLVTASLHIGTEAGAGPLAFAEVRERLLPPRPATVMSPIEAAVARGEIDPARLTPRLATLHFALFRHEVLFTGRALTEDAIREIVDDIVVPLLTAKA